MPIVVTKPGSRTRKIERKIFDDESNLQTYIADNPECLPLEQIDEDIQLFIAVREFSTESGPVDALGLDRDGNVYLIETKLYRNTDKRRVISQVLDYGAGLWSSGTGPEGFVTRLKEGIKRRFGVSAEKKLAEVFQLDATEVPPLLNDLQGNVARGRFRFVVLMDHIDDRLKALIRFVNENSEFSVFGVELEFYPVDDYTIAIPRLFGAESQPSAGNRGSRGVWDEAKFFDDLSKRASSDVVERVRKAFEFTGKQADTVSWGTGISRGSFSAKFDAISPKSVYSVYSDGRLELNFRWLRHSEAGRKATAQLGEELRKANFNLSDDYADRFLRLAPEVWTRRWPEIAKVLSEVIAAARQR